MDLLMPRIDGATAIGHLRRELPDTEVLAPTRVPDDAKVVEAVRWGNRLPAERYAGRRTGARDHSGGGRTQSALQAALIGLIPLAALDKQS